MRCSKWILTNISNNNHSKNITWHCSGANTARKEPKKAAILKFKMAAEDTLEKNGSNSGCVDKSIKKAKSIVSTNVANFALDYAFST